ncbi:unnamed protein product [Mytilus coruscus]|uniref:CCHC-type domain-containing protein n=1 Tax=Mytilus coruscus TaxID=42192 RepID=A0A6J8DF41_MYTCO|nr:unnamed protein product [Mytilus coruscus]
MWEGNEWYVTFITDNEVEALGDGTRRSCKESGSVYFDRIDARLVRFRIHWFPLHMKKELLEEWLKNFGSNVKLEEDFMEYNGMKLKTGSLSGSMRSNETQYNSIPYRRMVYNRPVLITVLGREPVCLKCGERGHQRSAFPDNPTRMTYAKAVSVPETDRNGESTQVSADVPTISSEGSTGRPDVLSSSEGSPSGPSSEGPSQDRGTEQQEMEVTEASRKRGRDEHVDKEKEEENGKKILVKEDGKEPQKVLTLGIKPKDNLESYKIFGGDFNCIVNSKLDKIGGNDNRGLDGADNLKLLKVVKEKDIVGINLPGTCENCKISVFADDSTGILTSDKSITKFLYLIDLYGKGTGSKLNKTKTRGIWLGAWKNRKDNYRFGIDFVDSMKIIGIKTGNDITQDDIWQPIYIKFEKMLNMWRFRS